MIKQTKKETYTFSVDIGERGATRDVTLKLEVIDKTYTFIFNDEELPGSHFNEKVAQAVLDVFKAGLDKVNSLKYPIEEARPELGGRTNRG